MAIFTGTAILKLITKAATNPGALTASLRNLKKISKLSSIKTKLAGKTYKEQIQIIYNSDEYKQLRTILNEDKLFEICKDEIKNNLSRSFQLGQCNQYLFVSEQELFAHINARDNNATIVLLMETIEIDLYVVEMRIQNDITSYATQIANIQEGIDIASVFSGNEQATTKSLYAVLKRNAAIQRRRKRRRKEDTKMYKFLMWLKNNFYKERVQKKELRLLALRKFAFMNDRIFYTYINTAKHKHKMLYADKSYYYIHTTPEQWVKENPEQIIKEIEEQFKL